MVEFVVVVVIVLAEAAQVPGSPLRGVGKNEESSNTDTPGVSPA